MRHYKSLSVTVLIFFRIFNIHKWGARMTWEVFWSLLLSTYTINADWKERYPSMLWKMWFWSFLVRLWIGCKFCLTLRWFWGPWLGYLFIMVILRPMSELCATIHDWLTQPQLPRRSLKQKSRLPTWGMLTRIIINK